MKTKIQSNEPNTFEGAHKCATTHDAAVLDWTTNDGIVCSVFFAGGVMVSARWDDLPINPAQIVALAISGDVATWTLESLEEVPTGHYGQTMNHVVGCLMATAA